jgi:hypothetical protein
MNSRTRILAVGASVFALAAGGAGAAMAANGGGGEDAASHVNGAAADQATKAALQITHGGTANSVERDSENGATWEVEVTKADGQTVDVRLDQNYHLVVVEGDSEAG